MTKYLLDANVFIDANNRHYAAAAFPGFWDWLDRASKSGLVASTRAVFDELMRKEDSLAKWARGRRDLFLSPSNAVFSEIDNIVGWATKNRYTDNAVAAFSKRADCGIVAQARVEEYTVVTYEHWDARAKKVKIPNACRAFNVKCVFPHQMLLAESARFVLDESNAP